MTIQVLIYSAMIHMVKDSFFLIVGKSYRMNVNYSFGAKHSINVFNWVIFDFWDQSLSCQLSNQQEETILNVYLESLFNF